MTTTTVRTARGGRTRRPGSALANLEGWGFVGPALVIIVGLSIFPAAWSFLLSLQDWNGFAQPEAVGLENYSDVLSDAEFWDAVWHTAGYTALFVPSSVLLGLFLAVALNRKIRFVGIYRTLIFVPFVASAAATGILSNYLFSPQFGLANNILRHLGLPAQGWLEDPSQAMVVIAIMALWGECAFTTVLFLAALQDMPGELIEAAKIDGAGPWKAFWSVVWPQLWPITIFTTIWQTITAFQQFDLVYTTTRGGPLEATQTVVYLLWETAFKKLEFGDGSAIAYLVFAATLVCTLFVIWLSRRMRIEAF